jgi:tetratricopeptide (TPR) repeat protein
MHVQRSSGFLKRAAFMRWDLRRISVRCHRNLLRFLILACAFHGSAQVQSKVLSATPSEPERWEELGALGQNVSRQSADYDYQYGLVLAQLELWDEADSALEAGRRLAPHDKRFPIELAGVAFREKNSERAISYLHRALQLDPKDAYANDFLATLYFLQGNLEAALKYWNAVGKPQIVQTRIEPALRVRPGLLDHAFAFAPETSLSLDELHASEARMRQLEIFSSYRFDLVAQPEGKFEPVFRAQELNGFGSTRTETLLRLLRGLPFQEVDPEYFNFRGAAVNLVSQLRWDPDKRRAFAAFSSPIADDPRWRFCLSAGARNENWDLVSSFTGPALRLAALNLRREEVRLELNRLAGARWSWLLGVETSHRSYRNVFAGTALTSQLLAHGYGLKETGQVRYQLWRSPERRIMLSSTANAQAARLWSQPAEEFERIQGSLEAHWLPRPRGDDFETFWRVRAGKTFGPIPFDELLMIGLERDNDLWLRAHIGTRDGRKGSAPLGRDYFLSNWETDKNIYDNGVIGVKWGPFLDTGKITDSAAALGSRKYLWDIGAQAKLRVLGVGVVFSYGKDLRSGNNALYTTLIREH